MHPADATVSNSEDCQKHILIPQNKKVFSSSVLYGFIEAVREIQKANQLYYGDFSLQNIF